MYITHSWFNYSNMVVTCDKIIFHLPPIIIINAPVNPLPLQISIISRYIIEVNDFSFLNWQSTKIENNTNKGENIYFNFVVDSEHESIKLK